MAATLERIPLRSSWGKVEAVIEPCFDADLWCWTILVDGNDFDSSYSDDRESAIADAKERWRDRLVEVES